MKIKSILTLAIICTLSQTMPAQANCSDAYLAKARAMWPETNDLKIGAIGAGLMGTGFLAMSATYAIGLGPVGLLPEGAAMIAYLDKVDRIGYFGLLIKDAHRFKNSGKAINSEWLPIDSDPALGDITNQSRLIRLMNHVDGPIVKKRSVSPNELMDAIIEADNSDDFCPMNSKGKMKLKTSMREFSQVIIKHLNQN